MEITKAENLCCAHTRQEIVDMFCQNIMIGINRAVSEGSHKTNFAGYICYHKPSGEIAPRQKPEWKWEDCDNYHYSFRDYRDEVKAAFVKAGYIIKPTGYIGGVWQNSEDICW